MYQQDVSEAVREGNEKVNDIRAVQVVRSWCLPTGSYIIKYSDFPQIQMTKDEEKGTHLTI